MDQALGRPPGGVAPMVRVVVVNYKRDDLTAACLDSLRKVDWPSDRLDVVVVDNGSSARSADVLATEHPWARVIRSPQNLGFAGGNNLALRDLDRIDYVALLNNDATVGPGWLAPLVTALEDDPLAGASCPKIVLAAQFAELTLIAEASRRDRVDGSSAVRLSGIEVDGVDRWDEVRFVEGPPPDAPRRWSGPKGRVRLPAGATVRLRLAAGTTTTVRITTTDGEVGVVVEPLAQWFEVPLGKEPFNVINNVGNRLEAGGYGADRGYLEADRGQYEEGVEVFAWCGASVLLRSAYLKDVGLFDERLFLYYEDIDLSWRGRARGWRYQYVPSSTVRHVHSATTVEGSAVSDYYVERNRLAVLAKNAPATLAWRAAGRFLLITASYARRDIAGPLLRGRPGQVRLGQTKRRLRSFAGYLRLLPSMLLARRRVRRDQTVADADLLGWMSRA